MNETIKPLLIVFGTLVCASVVYLIGYQIHTQQVRQAEATVADINASLERREAAGQALADYAHTQAPPPQPTQKKVTNVQEAYEFLKREQARLEAEAITIGAVDLGMAYAENQLKADNLYRGKILKVHGKVVSVMRDPSHVIGDGDVTVTIGWGSVVCSLMDSELQKAQTLSTGQDIFVKGFNLGGMTAVLNECVILQ